MNINKTGMVHGSWHWGTFMKPVLPCKSNKYYISLVWASVCSVSYHALYCHLWPVQCYVSFHIVSNSTIFEKVLLNLKCVLIFSITLMHVCPFIVDDMKRVKPTRSYTMVYWTLCCNIPLPGRLNHSHAPDQQPAITKVRCHMLGPSV
jgi:hypothetical protein